MLALTFRQGHEADASEAEQQHCPCRWDANRSVKTLLRSVPELRSLNELGFQGEQQL